MAQQGDFDGIVTVTRSPTPMTDPASHSSAGRRSFLRSASVALVVAVELVAQGGPVRAATTDTDPWAPLRRFIGEWSGESSGEAGTGTVRRQYAFVLDGTFVRETNRSEYPPQAKNPRGEVHEHFSIFSFDKMRKILVLRQFHVEGFVNSYRHVDDPGNAGALVFESESFENLSSLWKARETYSFASEDEFVETFELAPPGKAFAVYSRARLRRT